VHLFYADDEKLTTSISLFLPCSSTANMPVISCQLLRYCAKYKKDVFQ